MPTDNDICLTVRLIPAAYLRVPVHIKQGKASALLTINQANIQHPQPFNEDGRLTADCQSYIVEQVRSAIVHDGHDRLINWPPALMQERSQQA